MAKHIGVLTAGSDCPGINAAIRAIGKAAQASLGMEVIGFNDGFQGLVNDNVSQPSFSGILTAGGTILGTSRDLPHQMTVKGEITDLTDAAVATYHRHGLEGLVCIGGRETQLASHYLAQKGLKVITLPTGIDNNLAITDTTIGFDTALGTATEAIDRLHSTAYSHHRIIIIEVMGRHTGWLALGAGIAGGADVIIIPEIPYDMSKITEAILERNRSGRRFSIIVVSEGGISRDTVEFFEHSRKVNAMAREGKLREVVDQHLERIEKGMTGNTIYLANRLEKYTGLDSRITILGHLLRGGAPSAADRILATNLGTACVQFINENRYGVMVGVRDGDIVPIPIEQVMDEHKPIPLNHPWIESARRVGTNLGD